MSIIAGTYTLRHYYGLTAVSWFGERRSTSRLPIRTILTGNVPFRSELVITCAFDERLVPRTLHLLLRKAQKNICVRISVDLVLGSTVCLPLVGVVESGTNQLLRA